jgi:hypothetical protein
MLRNAEELICWFLAAYFKHCGTLWTDFLDCKLRFCQHAGYLFCHITKLLVLTQIITFLFYSLDSLLKLYIRLVGTKLEYASVSSKPLTNTDYNNASRPCVTTESYEIPTHAVAVLFFISEYCTLYWGAMLFWGIKRKVYNGFIICPSLLESAGIRVPNRNIRDCSTSCTSVPRNKCSSLLCALAQNENVNIVNVFDIHFFHITLLVSLKNR